MRWGWRSSSRSESPSRTRPGIEDAPLQGALLGIGQLEVVPVRRRLERAVARIRDHDPLASPARLVVLHDLQALGLAAAVVIDEVAEVVPDVDQDAIAPGDERAARPLRGAPVGLLARHEHGVDIAAHREPEFLEVL